MHALLEHVCVINMCPYTPVVLSSTKRKPKTHYYGMVLVSITLSIDLYMFMSIYADFIGVSMFCMLFYAFLY